MAKDDPIESSTKVFPGKVINYVLSHQDGLFIYPVDISNNIYDRATQNITIRNKHWLFNGSPKEAAA